MIQHGLLIYCSVSNFYLDISTAAWYVWYLLWNIVHLGTSMVYKILVVECHLSRIWYGAVVYIGFSVEDHLS